MIAIKPRVYLLIIIFANLITCASCSTTRPNEAFTGNYPKHFDNILISNPLLAKEIGKLPEIQNGLTEKKVTALKILCDLYVNQNDSFNNAFDQMNKIGKPNVRKFCTPLQALFWLAEDEKLDEIASVLDDYNLERLLTSAWKENLALIMPKSDMKYVIDNIRVEHQKDFYKKKWAEKDYGEIIYWLKSDYRSESNRSYKLFNYKSKRLIKKIMKKKDPRWSEYNLVLERLNAPELVHFYLNTKLHYVDTGKTRGGYLLFETGEGCCIDAAYLAVQALKKAGYKTFMRHVMWIENTPSGGHCVSGIILDDGRYLIVSDFGLHRRNRMSGPYDSLEEVDKYAARFNSIVNRTDGTFSPPGSQ